jgi:pimeloyl-ACP methyl ester carboxylesterase
LVDRFETKERSMPSKSPTKSIAAAAAGLAILSAGVSPARAEPVKNIVLVHGAFADGSGWRAVTEILQRDGYSVSIVQEPETSFADDVAATKRAIDGVKAPLILVGHSYGGAIITEAGNDPQVHGLVYVAAFQPDAGETLGSLLHQTPPASNSIVPAGEGYLIIDPKAFYADFAADLPAKDAAFMAISQVPISASILGAPITSAAWHNKPSWYAVATEDRQINPDLERFMAKRAGSTTIEVKGSHAIYASQPAIVAGLIEKAAKAAK